MWWSILELNTVLWCDRIFYFCFSESDRKKVLPTETLQPSQKAQRKAEGGETEEMRTEMKPPDFLGSKRATQIQTI